MKKGFTLIELLAVIIVLAIIALIATPTLINVIEEAKDKSDLESVHGILDSARLYYSGSMMNIDAKNDIENLNNIYGKVSLSVKEKTGELYINDKGLSAVAIVIRNKCYTKKFSGELKISSNINNCTLGFIGKDETPPTVIFSVEDGVFNSNNWAKNNFNVNITINDNESGPSSYKYCIDTNICDPIALVNKSTGFSEINSESLTNKVCVIGIDNYGNESEIICSDDYKLDKTNPTIAVDNISINKNTVIDLNSDITTNDTLSVIDNVTYDPTDIDTSIAGDKKVTYTVTDKAGNSASIERTITVITDKPTVSFTTLTNPNGNGWFNSDFYIKAQASVDNTTSVRNIKWCSSTSECVPITALENDNVTGYISTNSISNKMCVIATDATGISSDIICSNNYKLDSVVPTLIDKGENITITEGNNYQVSNYFNAPSYGISGGTLNCNPVNTSGLSVGTQTLSCIATSNSGLITSSNKNITVKTNQYIASKGTNAPILTSGMTPIKWNGTTEVTTTVDDSDWYDYSNKKWANAKTQDGSYWVWIPRYAYKITSGWHTSTTGTIDIKFLKNDTTENSSGTTIYTSGYSTTGTNTSNAYFLHPAFQNSTGNTKYGFWVAKFEMSNNVTFPKSLPNVTSIVYISVGDAFTYSKNMASNSSYGWSSEKVDTHMTTNYEWGAVAYLTQSSYGKNSEVWINNSLTFTTGCSGSSVSATGYSGCQNVYNTTTGMNASTTGNITGIYDMSGGGWEYIAAYVNNGNNRLTVYGNSIINSTINKNVYSITTDSQANNYETNKNMYGDAVYEISSSYSGTSSWNNDNANIPYSNSPWFTRGGGSGNTSYAGLFNFMSAEGSEGFGGSFRIVVLSTE